MMKILKRSHYLSLAEQFEIEASKQHSHGYKRTERVENIEVEAMRVSLAEAYCIAVGLVSWN